MTDLTPATDHVIDLVYAVRDDQLDLPTPCEDVPVRMLLSHIDGLAVAFRDAATKVEGPTTSTPPDFAHLELAAGWRERIPADLHQLALAWRDSTAWTGDTMVGGVSLPGEVAGLIAVDEVLLHGWDLARATDQAYQPDAGVLEACHAFLYPPSPQEEREGMFGPVIEVPDHAPLLDRVLGLAGRDPAWRQDGTAASR